MADKLRKSLLEIRLEKLQARPKENGAVIKKIKRQLKKL